MSRRAELVLMLGLALLTLAIRAPLWDLPLERDEGGYAYIAWRMGHGELLYLDWFDQKPPGIVLAYRLALLLPGDPVVAIRALAAAASALATVALYALARGLFGAGAILPAALAALLFAWLSADPMLQGPIANTELFMLPGVVAAAALCVRGLESERGRARRAFAIGALLGVATAFKQVAAVYVPLFLLLFAWRVDGPQRGRRLAVFGAWLGLGGLCVWLPLLGWLHARGALPAALDAVFLHNLEYAGVMPLAARWQAFRFHVTPLLPTQGAAWLLAAAGLAWLAIRRERFAAWFLAGVALASAIGVSASGRYFPHYFQQLLPAVAVLAGATALVPARSATFVSARGARLAWLRSALPLAALVPLVIGAVALWRLDSDTAMQRIYPGSPFEAMPALAAEIASLTRPQDRVLVFGAEPELLFYAQRVSASRYIYLFPLYGRYGDVGERQREFIAEVSRAQPAVIAELPNRMTQGGALARWLESITAAGYRAHAVVAWDAESRGRLVRLADRAPPADGVWATLWLRSDLALEHGAKSREPAAQ